jgi:hypothetical protein
MEITSSLENIGWVIVYGDSVYHFESFDNANRYQLIIGGALMPKFYFESHYKEINPPKSKYIYIKK